MEGVKQALLYLDLMAGADDDDEQAAVGLASHLAQEHGTHVTALHVVPEAPWYAKMLHPSREELQHVLLEERRELLAERLSSMKEQGLGFSFRVCTGKPALAVVREVMRGQQQLVIKGANDKPAKSGLLPDATSRSLLRRCPCPVWLARSASAARKPQRVLVAMKPEPFRPASLAFCRKLLTWADWAARTMRAELYVLDVVTVSQVVALFPATRIGDIDTLKQEIVKAAELCFEEDVEPCVAPIPDDRLWFVDGDPATTIPQFVEAHEISLLVMGTVRHVGPGNLLMGDVAEHAIDRVRCSVLGLKPDGFQRPGLPPEDQEDSRRSDGLRPSTSESMAIG